MEEVDKQYKSKSIAPINKIVAPNGKSIAPKSKNIADTNRLDKQYKNKSIATKNLDEQSKLIFKYSIIIGITILVYMLTIYLRLVTESGDLVSTTNSILNSIEIILPDLVKQSKQLLLDIANIADIGLTVYNIGNLILDFIISICYNFVTYIILSISTIVICRKNTKVRQVTYKILNSLAIAILIILMIIYFPTKLISWLDNIKALISLFKIMNLADIQDSILKIVINIAMPIFQFMVYIIQAITIFRYTFIIKGGNTKRYE